MKSSVPVLVRGLRGAWWPVAIAATLGAAALEWSRSASPDGGITPVATARREALIRDLDITFFQTRVQRDSTGTLDLIRLAGLQLDRGRATGSESDFEAAEHNASKSLLNAFGPNPAARQLLIATLVARHRFSQALAQADTLVVEAEQSPTARAIQAEVLLELGRYAEADSIFLGLQRFRAAMPVGTRLARWAEIRGRPATAVKLMESFEAEATANDLTTAGLRGWLRTRLAELALKRGRLGEARRWSAGAVAANPDDPRVLFVAARVALADGRPREALERAERAITVRPEPGTFALLVEIAEALGDTSRREEYLAATRATLGLDRPGFHRAAAMMLLDRGLDVDAIALAAERELETRSDLGGLQLVALARYRRGQVESAREALRRALAINPDDPDLARQATLILPRGMN